VLMSYAESDPEGQASFAAFREGPRSSDGRRAATSGCGRELGLMGILFQDEAELARRRKETRSDEPEITVGIWGIPGIKWIHNTREMCHA
jgi:hypothetical protein